MTTTATTTTKATAREAPSSSSTTGAGTSAASPRRRGRPKGGGEPQTARAVATLDVGRDAKRTAAAILEVLAGTRTTTEAAAALGVSVPRYYALEARALAAVVKACEPRRRGPRQTAERELVSVRRENGRLVRELARAQALLRAASRSVGLPPPPEREAARGGKGAGKKKRRKRPTARALVAAKALRAAPGADEGGGGTAGAAGTPPTTPMVQGGERW